MRVVIKLTFLMCISQVALAEKMVVAKQAMVVSDQRLASQVGKNILLAGNRLGQLAQNCE